jgi:thioredoxin 2
MQPTADPSGIIVACAGCGAQTRLRYERLDARSRCARCKVPIAAPDEPIHVPTAEAFGQLVASSSLPVLVDFWADWCGPCHMVAPEVARVAAARQGRVVVAKVDTEALPDVARRWRVQSLPTLALFAGGSEAARISGARPASAILSFVDQHDRRG